MDLRKAALLRSLLIKTEEKSNPTLSRVESVDGMAFDHTSTNDLPNLQVTVTVLRHCSGSAQVYGRGLAGFIG